MTPAQRQRLAELSDKLADTVISDADPDHWTAAGTTLADMTKEQRGDAAWCRKTAIQSVALLIRVEQLVADTRPPRTPEDDAAMEAETKRAEKAAAALLARVSKRAHAGQ